MISKRTILFLVLLLLISLKIKAVELNVLHFENETQYTAGSGVSIIFNPIDTFAIDNQFILELSGNNGNWAKPVLLKNLTDFYSPIVNGVIPTGTSAGFYKLRLRSTHPVAEYETPLFSVVSTTAPTLSTLSSTLPNNTNFFNCVGCASDNFIFGSHNQQEGATTNILNLAQRSVSICNYDEQDEYYITLHNVLAGTHQQLNQENGTFIIPETLNIGTYVFEIKK